MGILDRFQRSAPPAMDKRSAFRLTATGRGKIQEFSDDPHSRILVALECGGSQDVEELRSATGLSGGQLERVLPSLMRKGYIAQGGGGKLHKSSQRREHDRRDLDWIQKPPD